MIKVMTVLGARPQFIKAAVLSKLLSESKCFNEIIVHTGQHYDQNMSNIFFEELEINEPFYNLNINQGSHGEQTGNMLIEIEAIMFKEEPDLIIVYGDTNSTLAGALAGAKLHIPVAHVEAGLRSFDQKMPEEINRIITDHCSSILFCPSMAAVQNLEKEGITKNVFEVGDVMLDSTLFHFSMAQKRSDVLKRLRLKRKEYVLLTIHRESNTDIKENLKTIITAFLTSKKKVVFPIHPRTKKAMEKYSLYQENQNGNIFFIEPLGYPDMLVLEKNAEIIATDSGGIQKEAYFLGVPCITLRGTTEWRETIDAGGNVLVGAIPENIQDALRNPPKLSTRKALYGEGNACQKIVNILKGILQSQGGF